MRPLPDTLTPRARRGALTGALAVTTLAFAAVALPARAADAQAGKDRGLQIEPVMLDGAAGSGATLGLHYELKDTLASRASTAGSGSDIVDPDDIRIAGWNATYRVRGTLTARRMDNPRDLQDAHLDAGYRRGDTWGVLRGALSARYEADQKGNGRQAVLTLGTTYTQIGLLKNGDAFGIDLRYGQVDPKKDAVRKQALGNAPLDSYNRWDTELLYIFPLKMGPADRLEFNYRYYLEPGAPAAVRAARIDRHRLVTYRLGLPQDLFIAYSSGRLPFDRSAEQIIALGLTYKLP